MDAKLHARMSEAAEAYSANADGLEYYPSVQYEMRLSAAFLAGASALYAALMESAGGARQWTLGYDANFDAELPIVLEGPNIEATEQECRVIEYAALAASTARIRELEAALESIASKHKEPHATEEFWLTRTHEQCATVLATDTKIARAALARKGGK